MHYTEGEWRIEQTNNGIICTNGIETEQVCYDINSEENAKLIVLAPEMLETLKFCKKIFEVMFFKPKSAIEEINQILNKLK